MTLRVLGGPGLVFFLLEDRFLSWTCLQGKTQGAKRKECEDHADTGAETGTNQAETTLGKQGIWSRVTLDPIERAARFAFERTTFQLLSKPALHHMRRALRPCISQKGHKHCNSTQVASRVETHLGNQQFSAPRGCFPDHSLGRERWKWNNPVNCVADQFDDKG